MGASFSGSSSGGGGAVTQSGIWTVQPGNTANTTAWKVDGSAVTQPVSLASLPALAAGAAVIGHVIADTGSTTAVTGTVAVTESGTWTVQPGNTQNTTAWLVNDLDATATGAITTQNLTPTVAGTAGSFVSTGNLNGVNGLTFQVTGVYTGVLSLQGTVDGTNWITLGIPIYNVNTAAVTTTVASAAVGIFTAQVAGFKKVQVTGLAAMTGTATVTLQASAGAAVAGGINLLQANGTQIGAGNGTGASSVRVTVASDSTGQIAVVGRNTGGLTKSRVVSAATTNSTNVRASAGTFFKVCLTNTTTAAKFLKLYDKATAPTVGTDTPVLTVVIPANTSANGGLLELNSADMGVLFSLGIGYGITGLVADADTTATAAGDVTGWFLIA